MVRRDNGAKIDVPWGLLPQAVAYMLVTIQHEMLAKARATRDAAIHRVLEWKDFTPTMARGHLALTPFCNDEQATEFEELVKDKSKAEALAMSGEAGEDERTATSVAAKTLCVPFAQPKLAPGTKCFISGKYATVWVLWGRSY